MAWWLMTIWLGCQGTPTAPPEQGEQVERSQKRRGRKGNAKARAKAKAKANAKATQKASDAEATPKGKWFRAPERHDVDPEAADDEALIAALEAIGYADGTVDAGAVDVMSISAPDARTEGVYLYSSGHAPEALLVDASGAVLHTWRKSYAAAFPDNALKPNGYNKAWGTKAWRRVALRPDGGLVAIYAGFGIVALDRTSEVLWANPLRVHHDLVLEEDGSVWTLDRVVHVDEAWADYPIVEDRILHLSVNGEVLTTIELVEAFVGTPYEALVRKSMLKNDVFHTNTLVRLDGSSEARNPAFKEGHFLISLRSSSLLAVVDPEAGKVTWAAKGAFKTQHDPQQLSNGSLVLFDNTGAGRKSSRLLVLDPMTLGIEREWTAPDLYSHTLGAVQVLPNDHVLLTVSEPGFALEVLPDDRVAWSFSSPHRAGENKDLVAALFDVTLWPREAVDAWLGEPPTP
ncbi:MAG: arylsulfotransferase family protein [Myxococcota bacterium]